MNFVQIIMAAAKAAKISGAILLAVCSHESGLKNIITPHDGGSPSIGICQVKSDTAAMLGYQGKPDGLLDPATNAKYAALYLKYQYDRYGGDWHKTISAYNAGRYNESSIIHGCSKNIKYVNSVKNYLDNKWKEKVKCEEVKSQEISLEKDSEG